MYINCNLSFRLSSLINREIVELQKCVQMIVTMNKENRVKKSPFSIQDGCQKSKMASTKFSFLTFSHQTAVISRASSRLPCYIFFILLYIKCIDVTYLPKLHYNKHDILNYLWFTQSERGCLICLCLASDRNKGNRRYHIIVVCYVFVGIYEGFI